MKVKLFLLALCWNVLAAIESIPYQEIAYGGEPRGLVGGCVNVISGDYVLSEVDWVVQGHQPIVIKRRHLSSQTYGDQWAGWEFFFNHLKANFYVINESYDPVDQATYETGQAVIPEKYGFSLAYEGTFLGGNPSGSLKLKGEYPHALTNCHTGEIGGRYNTFNNHVCFDPDAHTVLKVYGPDSSIRAYQRFKGDKEEYYLRWERLPNGNKVHYQWHEVERERRLKRVTTTDEHVKKTYAWMDIDYVMHGRRLDRIEIRTSDQQHIIYKMAHKQGERQTFWALEKVESTSKPTLCYDYWGNKKTSYFVCDRLSPQGRRLRIDYYLKGDNPLSLGNVVIKKKTDKAVMRVKRLRLPLLKNHALQSIFEFYYRKPGSYRNKGGYTDVVDPYGNPSRYTFNENFLLTEVNHQEKGKGTFAKERFEWTPYHARKGHWLRGKTLEDRNGAAQREIQYTYDKRGNAIEETLIGDLTGKGNHAERYVVKRSYNKANLVTKECFPNGRTIEYTYMPQSNLIHQKLILNHDRIQIRHLFTYEGTVLREKIIDDGNSRDPNSLQGVTERRILTISPRTQEPFLDLPNQIEEKYLELTTQKESLLGRQKFVYTPFGKPKQTLYYDANGDKRFAIEFTYDHKGRLMHETDPLERVKKYQYDENDNVTVEAQPDHELAIHQTFDSANRLTQVSEGERCTRFQYNYLGQKEVETHYRGTEARYTHDPFGHPIHIQKPAVQTDYGSVKHPSVNRVYNALDCIAQEKDPEGNVTQTFYTSRGKPKRIIHPNGTEEAYQYNLEGEVILHVQPGGSKTVYERDFLNRITSKKVFSKTGEPLSTETYVYNAFHLIKKIAPDGIETTYQYDGAGRKCAEKTLDHLKTFHYDALGREEKVIVSQTQCFHKTYDLLNRILEEREEDLSGKIYATTRYQYDDYSNQTAMIKEVQVGESIERTEYDPYKREIRKIDPLGNTTQIEYDDYFLNAIGQKVLRKKTTNPRGVQTFEEYDALEHLVCLEKYTPEGELLLREVFFYDQCGNQKRQESTLNTGETLLKGWEYDSQGRVTKLTEALGTPYEKITTYTYTPDGQLQEIVKPDGISISYTYDGLGRKTSVQTSDGACHYTLQYNPMGQIIQSNDLIQRRKTIREYDHFGNLLHETLANGLTLHQKYDNLNRKTQQTLPDHSSIHYTYDPFHLIAMERSSGQTHYSHTFDAYDQSHHLLQETLLGAGGRITYQIDLCGRRVQSQSNHSLEEIPELDPNGNPLSYSRTTKNQEECSTYAYDFLDQLIQETGPFASEYTYDSHHNRLQKNATDYFYNPLHQLTATTDATYQHDPNGNRTHCKTPTHTLTYTYDGLDRLIQIQDTTLSYDYWGRCIIQTQNSHPTPLLYDDQKELGAYPHELRILNPTAPSEIGATLAIEKNGFIYIPLQDLLGNLIALLTPNGLPIESYRFSSFGEETTSSTPLIPWRYQSKRKTTHLINFGRRFYDPHTGRWLTPDPKGYPEGPNLYQFNRNNSFANIDLFGLSTEIKNNILHDFSYACYYSFRTTLEGYATVDCTKMSFSRNFSQAVLNIANGDLKAPIDHSCVFDIPGAMHPNVEAVLSNGINTTKQEAYEMGRTVSKELNGLHVRCVYNNTHGILFDVLDFFIEKQGFPSNAGRLLYREVKDILDRGKRALVEIHSESHAIFNSIESLFTPEEKARIEVYGFGSVAPISQESANIVENYVSKNDLVAFFGSPMQSIRHKICEPSHINYLTPHTFSPLNEHAFHGETYTQAREEVNGNLIRRYGL